MSLQSPKTSEKAKFRTADPGGDRAKYRAMSAVYAGAAVLYGVVAGPFMGRTNFTQQGKDGNKTGFALESPVGFFAQLYTAKPLAALPAPARALLAGAATVVASPVFAALIPINVGLAIRDEVKYGGFAGYPVALVQGLRGRLRRQFGVSGLEAGQKTAKMSVPEFKTNVPLTLEQQKIALDGVASDVNKENFLSVMAMIYTGKKGNIDKAPHPPAFQAHLNEFLRTNIDVIKQTLPHLENIDPRHITIHYNADDTLTFGWKENGQPQTTSIARTDLAKAIQNNPTPVITGDCVAVGARQALNSADNQVAIVVAANAHQVGGACLRWRGSQEETVMFGSDLHQTEMAKHPTQNVYKQKYTDSVGATGPRGAFDLIRAAVAEHRDKQNNARNGTKHLGLGQVDVIQDVALRYNIPKTDKYIVPDQKVTIINAAGLNLQSYDVKEGDWKQFSKSDGTLDFDKIKDFYKLLVYNIIFNAAQNDVKTLDLNAIGCGVFAGAAGDKQMQQLVSDAHKEVISAVKVGGQPLATLESSMLQFAKDNNAYFQDHSPEQIKTTDFEQTAFPREKMENMELKFVEYNADKAKTFRESNVLSPIPVGLPATPAKHSASELPPPLSDTPAPQKSKFPAAPPPPPPSPIAMLRSSLVTQLTELSKTENKEDFDAKKKAIITYLEQNEPLWKINPLEVTNIHKTGNVEALGDKAITKFAETLPNMTFENRATASLGQQRLLAPEKKQGRSVLSFFTRKKPSDSDRSDRTSGARPKR